jgi:outer membrane protein TolC
MGKFVLALCAALSLSAQTLESFIEQVLSKNPEIASLESQYKAAVEEAKIASSWDNPQLNVQITNIDFKSPGKRDIEPMQQIMYGLTQNIPLTNKFSVRQSAKLMAADSLKNRVMQKKLDIEFAVKKNAYELAKAKETKKIYEKYLQTLKYALEISRASNLDKETGHNELIRGEMEIASFMRKITDLEAEANVLQKSLYSFGTKPENELSITFDMPLKEPKSVSFETSREYAAINSEFSSIQKELQSEKLSIIPDIGVNIGYASADAQFRDYWFLGITIPLPIYGKENASVRKKAFELSAKKEEMEDMKNKLELELESSKIKLVSAQKNYKLTDKILKTQLKHLLESALSSSKASAESKAYAISAIKDALSLELDLIGYKYDANVAAAQIKKVSGHEI